MRLRQNRKGAMPAFHLLLQEGEVMQTFDLVNILIIALAAVVVIGGAVLHKRALKKALAASDTREKREKYPIRGLRRYRQQ